MVWTDGGSKGEEQTSSWPQNNEDGGDTGTVLENKEEMETGPLTTFKSMLEAENEDWYMTNSGGGGGATDHQAVAAMHDISFSPTSFAEAAAGVNNQLLLQPVDSSASCSPTSASVFNNNNLDAAHQHQVNYFLQHKPFINPIQNNHSFDLGCESGYLETALNRGGGILSSGFNDLSAHPLLNLGSNSRFPTSSFVHLPQGNMGSGGGVFGLGEGSNSSFLFNRSKILKPLDHNFGSLGSQPTLFQKRAALRKNLGSDLGSLNLERIGNVVEAYDKERELICDEMNERKRKTSSGDDLEDLSIDGSNLNYDSDDQFLENSGVSKAESESVKAGGGDQKGKRKGMPAKNLMAERRRRKKLNDRLYMLRSVVPKISKVWKILSTQNFS